MKKRATLLVTAICMALVLASGVALAAAGDLDQSFGDNGVASASFGNSRENGEAMVVRPDGRIVVAGGADTEGFGLASFNPDGSLDQTFGGDGRVFTDVGGDGYEVATAVATQTDGKLLAAGTAERCDENFDCTTRFTVLRHQGN